MPKFDKDVFECLIDKVIIGEVAEDGTINPYTIRFICKNGTEINCKDKFTATSDKQHSNNTATREKQHMWSAWQCLTLNSFEIIYTVRIEWLNVRKFIFYI